jgi:2-methylisocitrate lyase-like PEP mutase family enzyme
MRVKVFVNARTDALRYFEGDDDEKFMEAVHRCREFREAGAGCVYPMALVRRDDIDRFLKELNGYPTNIMIRTGTPPLNELEEMGVKEGWFWSGGQLRHFMITQEDF